MWSTRPPKVRLTEKASLAGGLPAILALVETRGDLHARERAEAIG